MRTHKQESFFPIKKPSILESNIGRETILYNETDEAIHVLNSSAKLIWDLCDGRHSVDEMEREMRDRFSVPEGQELFLDIQRTIEIFGQKGLLQVLE